MRPKAIIAGTLIALGIAGRPEQLKGMMSENLKETRHALT